MELVATPENPLPEGAVCSKVMTGDGIALRVLSAQVRNPRGTVVVLGGRADFMERYFETMRDLMARGFSVASLDLRGQGGSQRLLPDPLRGYITRFEQYDEDIRSFMTQAVLPNCPPPYYGLGHSTGGNVLLRSLRQRNWFKRCILVSPLLGVGYGPWPLPVVKILTFLAVHLRLGSAFLPGQRQTPLGRADYPDNPLTLDHQRWNRDSAVLEANPQLAVGGPTYAWLRAAMKSMAALQRIDPAHGLRCPLLIVAAGRDTVVDVDATYRFAQNVAGVSMIVIREALHEILLERDEVRQQFFAAFDAFVLEKP